MTDKASDGHELLRIKLSFAKFVLGTLILGSFTVWLNSEIQSQRLEFEIRSNENAFIAQFLDTALDVNLEKRRDFAEYFVRLTPTQESRERWIEYRDYTQSLVLVAQQKANEIAGWERELASLKGAKIGTGTVSAGAGSAVVGSGGSGTAEDAALHKRIAELQAEIDRQRRELATIRSEPIPSIVQVPDVVGLEPSRAKGVIENAGLYVGQFIHEESDKVQPDHVVRVMPPPGTKLARGENVDLFVTPDSYR